VNRELAEKIANTVLYEGYMLYPYRASALKNQQRWNFGTLYPPKYEEVKCGTERSTMNVECLIGGAPQSITAQVRFLQLTSDNGNRAAARSVELSLDPSTAETTAPFEMRDDAAPVISGEVRASTQPLRSQLSKLMIQIANTSPIADSPTRNEAQSRAMFSAHVILYASAGEFISLLDPPDDLREWAAGCKNVGCFPVLVGDAGERKMLLCSPIILYDYPQIAPESVGDFFDATEMDEMLTLRVMTLTPEEKQEMASCDDRARELLERTERSAREQLMRTHGTIRSMRLVNEP
jgi:hypothetical protein